MRIVWVLVLWVSILSGVATFIGRSGGGSFSGGQVTKTVEASIVLELTATFDSAGDAFEPGEVGASGVEVRNGRNRGIAVGPLEAGVPLNVGDLGPVEVGDNEIYVRALPASDDGLSVHALRLRVWQGHGILAETTVWDDGTRLVDGVIRFRVLATEVKGEDHGA